MLELFISLLKSTITVTFVIQKAMGTVNMTSEKGDISTFYSISMLGLFSFSTLSKENKLLGY